MGKMECARFKLATTVSHDDAIAMASMAAGHHHMPKSNFFEVLKIERLRLLMLKFFICLVV
jgi:hypothetical protein